MVVATEDLCCRTGCLCYLQSWYWKLPDCISFDCASNCLCWETSCRTGFPMSICTMMGQCCCFDIRCALPCDPSNVPITIGVCGLLCVNCKRGGCGDQCGNMNLYKLCPCFGKGVWGDRKKFGSEEAPLQFYMNDRKEVTVKDRSGKVCLVRLLDEVEAASLMLKMAAEEDQQLPGIPRKANPAAAPEELPGNIGQSTKSDDSQVLDVVPGKVDRMER